MEAMEAVDKRENDELTVQLNMPLEDGGVSGHRRLARAR